MQRYFFCKSGLSLIEVIRRESPALITAEELIARLERDPSSSAESDTLNRLKPAAGDFIRFFTASDEYAILQAQALSLYYRKRGLLTAVEVLNYPRDHIEELRLYEFILRVMGLVLACSELHMVPEFIATSGFKHEVIYMSALGLCERIPVRYLKEDSGALVKLPPLPMRWDTSVMDVFHSFFKDVKAGSVDASTLETMLYREPVLKPYFVVEKNSGQVFLSPIGELVHMAWASKMFRRTGFDASRVVSEIPVEDLVTGLDDSVSAYTLRVVDRLTRLIFVRGIYTAKTKPTEDGDALNELKIEDNGKTDILYLRFPAEYPAGHDRMRSVVEALI